jgi:transcriptional regulator with XRE-family HTH domain
MSSDAPLRDSVAAEMRAEMARQRRTATELAAFLGCSVQSASRRLNGEVRIDLDEVALIADWLGVPFERLVAA